MQIQAEDFNIVGASLKESLPGRRNLKKLKLLGHPLGLRKPEKTLSTSAGSTQDDYSSDVIDRDWPLTNAADLSFIKDAPGDVYKHACAHKALFVKVNVHARLVLTPRVPASSVTQRKNPVPDSKKSSAKKAKDHS